MRRRPITRKANSYHSGQPSTILLPAKVIQSQSLTIRPRPESTALTIWAAITREQPGLFSMWGGDITAVGAPQIVSGTYAGDSETAIQVTFTAGTGGTAVLAWGAHVANEADWGAGSGAFNISGSPYHVAIDFNGGHQDHQMQASVVVIPHPSIALDKTHAAIVDIDNNGPDAGDTVTYSYLVTNTGDVTLSNLSVHDNNGTPDTGDDFTITIAGTLAPGASTTVSSAPRVLTQAEFDSGSVTNIATDQGTSNLGQTVTAGDTDTVPFAQSPQIALDKTHAT